MSQELHMTNTTLVVSLACNLRCKLCAVSAPYYKNTQIYSLDSLKTIVDNYFNTVDFVDKFTINGGEPMIYPHISEIIEHISRYSNKIGLLEMLSNSTVVPNDKLIDALKKSKVDVMLDDYGPNISKGADKTEEIFIREGIRYRRRIYYGENAHFGGWVDLRDLSLKPRTENETAYVYDHCAYPGPFHCFAIFGGKAFICGVYKRLFHDGIINDDPEEYVDFLSNDFDPNQSKEKISNFYNRKFFSACKYCDGFTMDRERFAPAEQK